MLHHRSLHGTFSIRRVPVGPVVTHPWRLQFVIKVSTRSFLTTRAKGFCGKNFHHKRLFFRHKLVFVATFKVATSHHRYSPHRYSSDDFLFPHRWPYSLVTTCGTTSKVAICGPIGWHKNICISGQKNATYNVFSGENSCHDYRVFMAILASQLPLKVTNYMVTNDYILVTKVLPLYKFTMSKICSHYFNCNCV
jgi:hypothetical protein